MGTTPRALVAVTIAVLAVTGCSTDAPISMPDVVGKPLDVALSDVKRAGFEKEVEVLGGGILGILDESNWTVCSQEPESGAEITSVPRIAVDRRCESDDPEQPATDDPTTTPSEDPSPEPEESEPEAYTYQGPQYEILTVDEDLGPAKLDQYWVYTAKFDYTSDAYRDQVKMIIADIARTENTDELIVEVVSDKEIAWAEAASTYEAFIREYGMDYAIKVIPEKEKTDWVASYTGGYDSSLNEASGSVDAFEILWLPYFGADFEKWRPQSSP